MKFPSTPQKNKTIPLIGPERCLAKSYMGGKGCDVYTHLCVTCLIVRELRNFYSNYKKEEFFSSLTEWLAATHDIGKMTPAFQNKIYRAIGLSGELPENFSIEESPGGHPLNSFIALEQSFGEDFSSIVGAHHGKTCKPIVGDDLRKEDLGGEPWQCQRENLWKKIQKDLSLPEYKEQKIQDELKSVYTGALILSDWLSSSLEIPFGSPIPQIEKLRKVIVNSGLYPRLFRNNLPFEDIFNFPPNDLQKTCLEHIVPGSVYVIEAGMGCGKTEAALSIAYQILADKKADGIYFALPTRLTSEKIYDRFNAFLEHVSNEKDIKSIQIHGTSFLDWDLFEENEDGSEHKVKDGWFQSKKRALLAPFGVGTIDQALLAVVNVRHRDLRAFALAGKVVIFDEVHSYDAYTGSLLASLIEKLRTWGCTVILLSATLTAEACKSLACLKDLPQTSYYPRVLIQDFSNHVTELEVPDTNNAEVFFSLLTDEEDVMREVLERAENGEQVLWIENTVKDAQRIFSKFASDINQRNNPVDYDTPSIQGFFPGSSQTVELGLIHSRYPSFIRNKKENYWIDILGKKSTRRNEHGRILISTQVLEQSVDIDADFLVTRLAPVDFIFQRVGRLWRHRGYDGIRPENSGRNVTVLYSDYFHDTKTLKQHKDDFRPYDAYCLYRTYCELQNRTSILVPSEIRGILERTYADIDEKDEYLIQLKNDVKEKKEHLKQYASVETASGWNPKSDDSFGTRYSEKPTVQVLLLKKCNKGDDLKQMLWPEFSNEPILLNGKNKSEKLEITKKLMDMLITVNDIHAPTWDDFPADFLKDYLWIGDSGFRPIRLAYVNEGGELLDGVCNTIERHRNEKIFYHKSLGYSTEKEKLP